MVRCTGARVIGQTQHQMTRITSISGNVRLKFDGETFVHAIHGGKQMLSFPGALPLLS